MFYGCVIKQNIFNEFWTYIFYPTKINTNEVFSYFWKTISCKSLLHIYFTIQEYKSKRLSHKRKLTDSYLFQKSLNSTLLFRRYIKICNSTPIKVRQYAPHLSTLEAVFEMHCLYANAVVQPSVQHSAHVTRYESWRFILNVDTVIFV